MFFCLSILNSSTNLYLYTLLETSLTVILEYTTSAVDNSPQNKAAFLVSTVVETSSPAKLTAIFQSQYYIRATTVAAQSKTWFVTSDSMLQSRVRVPFEVWIFLCRFSVSIVLCGYDRLFGLDFRVPDYRPRGPGLDSRAYQII
jgi:hypothetical protein